MNKKILRHSAIVSVVTFVLFFLCRYLYPDAVFGTTAGFMLFSGCAAVVNWVRWVDVYGPSHPGENAWRLHFAENAPDANAICFNAFKWGGSMFLFWAFTAIPARVY